MSKKFKKNKINVNEEVVKKNIWEDGQFLDKNIMDHTQFMSFLESDFTQSNGDLKMIIANICSDLQYLLESEFSVFWSTINYNRYLQKMMESFYRFAVKQKFYKLKFTSQPAFEKNQDEETKSQMDDIYQKMFALTHRICYHEIENKKLSESFNCNKSIYDLWLLDCQKFFDIIQIYGKTNESEVKQMIKYSFQKNPDYHIDFKDLISLSLEKILKPGVYEIVEQIKRSKFEDFITQRDSQRLIKQLIILNDLTLQLQQSFKYFPNKCLEVYFFDEILSNHLENLYYHITNSKKLWKLGEYVEQFQFLFRQIQYNVVQYFVNYLQFWQNSFTSNQINPNNASKYQARLSQIIHDFGSVKFYGKKDEKNYQLLKHIQKRFSLDVFLRNLPVFIKLDEEKLVLFLSICSSFNEAKQNFQEEEEKNQVEEDNDITIEMEQKIKITDAYTKKKISNDQKDFFLQNPDEREQMAKAIKQQMEQQEEETLKRIEERQLMQKNKKQKLFMDNEYDDEYDDTYGTNYMRSIQADNKQVEDINDDDDDNDDYDVDKNYENDNQQNNGAKNSLKDEDLKPYQKPGFNPKIIKKQYQKRNIQDVKQTYQDEPEEDQQKQKQKEYYKKYTNVIAKQKQEAENIKLEGNSNQRDGGYAVEKTKKTKNQQYQKKNNNYKGSQI